VIKYNR
jgi:Ca2+-binding EF-hand superfamily protein